MNRSIRKNILIILLVAQGILTAVCATALVLYINQQRAAVFDTEIRRRAGNLIAMVQVDDSDSTRLEFSPQQDSLAPDDMFVIRDMKGVVLGSSPHSRNITDYVNSAAGRDFSFSARGREYKGRLIQAIPIIDQDEERADTPAPKVDVLYATPATAFNLASRQIITIAVLGSLFWSTSSCLIAWFSVTRGMIPLGELAIQASAITERNWSLSLSSKVRRVSELRPLALALEALVLRLGSAFERERTFVSNAAHELKTVVAIQKSSLQVALQGPESTTGYKNGLERASEDLDRLNVLVHRMLSLASIESSDQTRVDDPIALDETILAACDQLQPIATSHQIDLDLHLASRCHIASEEGLLQTLWVAIIENAIRYSPPGSTVAISSSLKGTACTVTIADHGAGISAEHLPHLFERFYRADSSRARETGGFGLGLAIAKAIVERHHGRIEVGSKPGQGTAVLVTLPYMEESTGSDG